MDGIRAIGKDVDFALHNRRTLASPPLELTGHFPAFPFSRLPSTRLLQEIFLAPIVRATGSAAGCILDICILSGSTAFSPGVYRTVLLKADKCQ